MQKDATTKNIDDIFKGKCNCDIDPSRYDCNNIWETFKTTITSKAPCGLKLVDNFLKLVSHRIQVYFGPDM